MFSVVIPVYNKAKFICFTIKSVLKQSFTDFELIIVNDGSTDNVLEILNENFSDPRIIIINQENGGVSSARNKGIQNATFGYVAFLDADDFWDPDYLEQFYKTIMSFNEISPTIIGCQYKVVKQQKILDINDNNMDAPYIVKNYFKTAHRDAIFWTSSTIIKTQVLRDLKGFNCKLTHGEDLDMWFRVMMLNPLAIFIPTRLSYYFMGDSNQAMSYLPKLESHLVGNILEMYAYKDELNHIPYFSVFLEKYLLKNIRPYYVMDLYKLEVQNIFRKISFWYLPYAFFYFIPRSIAKVLYKVKKKIG